MNSKDSFDFFLHSWLDSLDSIVTRLQCVPLDSLHETEQRDLVSLFMEHQESLFSAKRELVSRDPFMGIHLPWTNSLTRALQWFGGWRPVAAYSVAKGCRVVLPEQEVEMNAMRFATKVEEDAVEKETVNTESEVVRAFGRGRSISSMEVSIKATMKRVAVAADMARMEAVKRVVDVLAPSETVVYLAELGKMEAHFYGSIEVQV